MNLITQFERAQLAAWAVDGGVAITIWPAFFHEANFTRGQICLPPAADELYLAEISEEGYYDENLMCGIYLFRGDPAEPTRARFEARQLAREIRSPHYAWLHNGLIENAFGWAPITPLATWLQHLTYSAGLETGRWFTNSTF